MPPTCRLCLGSFSASHCSVITENQRGFALLLLWVRLSMGTWINLVHLESGRFGQAPKGSGSSWKHVQNTRPSRGSEMSCLLVFPPVALQLLLDLQPSAEASTGVPSCAHICVQHWGGSGHPCPRKTLLQRPPGEWQGRHGRAPSPGITIFLGWSRGGRQRFLWVCRGGICSSEVYLKLPEY